MTTEEHNANDVAKTVVDDILESRRRRAHELDPDEVYRQRHILREKYQQPKRPPEGRTDDGVK